MVKKVFEKNGAEQKMFREFYEIAQNYFIPEDSDEYWDSYIETSHNFIQGNIPFARDLSRALTYYLESEYLKIRKRGNNNADA